MSTQYNVYYMRPDWFADGIVGKKPDFSNIQKTHAFLASFNLEGELHESLDTIFAHMQAENWSPNGEARALIRSKGLRHTSMSVGDIIESNGVYYIVAMFGFDELKL